MSQGLNVSLLRLYFDGNNASEIAQKTNKSPDDVKFELSRAGVNIQQGDLCRFGSSAAHLGYKSPADYFYSQGPMSFKDMAGQLNLPVGWVRRYYDMFCELEDEE